MLEKKNLVRKLGKKKRGVRGRGLYNVIGKTKSKIKLMEAQ